MTTSSPETGNRQVVLAKLITCKALTFKSWTSLIGGVFGTFLRFVSLTTSKMPQSTHIIRFLDFRKFFLSGRFGYALRPPTNLIHKAVAPTLLPGWHKSTGQLRTLKLWPALASSVCYNRIVTGISIPRSRQRTDLNGLPWFVMLQIHLKLAPTLHVNTVTSTSGALSKFINHIGFFSAFFSILGVGSWLSNNFFTPSFFFLIVCWQWMIIEFNQRSS